MSAKTVTKTRFTLLHMGYFDAYKDEHVTLSPEEAEINKTKRIVWPLNTYAVLVQHPTLGNILYDTGNDAGWSYRWPKALADGYPIHEHCNLKEKLEELDLTVDDIDMLIISHLHFDHAGNIRMFRGTKAGQAIIVQEEEAKNAFFFGNKDDPALNLYVNGYVSHEFCGLDGIGYKMVQGDVKLADDLELLLLPGHTPGTMGLLVRTENTGTVIFPSDAIYNAINYGPPTVLPGMCARPVEYKASVDKCRSIVEAEKGTMFFSHDINIYKEYKKSPEWYD